MNLKLGILANFEFLGYRICQQTVHITSFREQLVQRSQKNPQPIRTNRIFPLTMDFIMIAKD